MDNLYDNPEILRDIILDHYKFPKNKGLIQKKGYHQAHLSSASCIDDITVEANIQNGIIKDIRFDGIGCAISTAATSIMTNLLVQKTIAEAQVIIDNYFAMVSERPYDAQILDEAIVMKTVYKQANRIKCATIGWKAMQQLIVESEENHE